MTLHKFTLQEERPTPVQCCTWLESHLRATGFIAYANRLQELLDEHKATLSLLREYNDNISNDDWAKNAAWDDKVQEFFRQKDGDMDYMSIVGAYDKSYYE